MKRCCLTLAVLAIAAPAPVAGAQTAPESAFAPDSAFASRYTPRLPLIQPRDAVLGAFFLGSLASIQVEGFDEFDELITPRPEQAAATHRSFGRNLGRLEVAAGLSGATFLVGKAVGSETTARVGLRSIESLILTAGLTTVLKVGFGRSRPDSGFEEDRFDPFSFQHSQWSFPSGHTSTAFAMATTVSMELSDSAPWVPYVAYPVAAWTGVSRILDEKHWLTDVVAGAAVGIFSARIINRLHRDPLAEYRAATGVTPRVLLTSSGDQHLFGLSLQH